MSFHFSFIFQTCGIFLNFSIIPCFIQRSYSKVVPLSLNGSSEPIPFHSDEVHILILNCYASDRKHFEVTSVIL